MRYNLQFNPDAGGGGGPNVDPKSRPPAEPIMRPKEIGQDVDEENAVDVDEQKQVNETWHRAGGNEPGEKKGNKSKP